MKGCINWHEHTWQIQSWVSNNMNRIKKYQKKKKTEEFHNSWGETYYRDDQLCNKTKYNQTQHCFFQNILKSKLLFCQQVSQWCIFDIKDEENLCILQLFTIKFHPTKWFLASLLRMGNFYISTQVKLHRHTGCVHFKY